MENFSVDEIVEDPTNDKNWVRWMKEHYKKQGFSEEHVAMILNNSKISNWPDGFRSKHLIQRNLQKIKELIGIYINYNIIIIKIIFF